MNTHLKNKKAFSLIELSIVILIVGIVVAGVTQSSRLIGAFRLSSARNITQSSPVNSIRNLTLWFDSTSEKAFDTSEADNATAVTNWYSINPQSTSSRVTITGSNKPLYYNSGINNLPALLYDGSNDCLYATVTASDIVSSTQATVFVVQYFTGATSKTTSTLWLAVTASSTSRVNLSAPETGYFNFDMGSIERTQYSVPSAAFINRPIVYSVFRNGSTAELRVNGGSALASSSGMASTMPSASSVLSVGCIDPGVNSTYSFQGYIGEVIVFDRALKVEERQAIEQYLGKKWGISVT